LNNQVFPHSNCQVWAIGQPLKLFDEVQTALKKALANPVDAVWGVPEKNH
jgi:hypothetical protein